MQNSSDFFGAWVDDRPATAAGTAGKMTASSSATTASAVREVLIGAAQEHPIAGVILSAWDQLPTEFRGQLAAQLEANIAQAGLTVELSADDSRHPFAELLSRSGPYDHNG